MQAFSDFLLRRYAPSLACTCPRPCSDLTGTRPNLTRIFHPMRCPGSGCGIRRWRFLATSVNRPRGWGV